MMTGAQAIERAKPHLSDAARAALASLQPVEAETLAEHIARLLADPDGEFVARDVIPYLEARYGAS